ncbi:HAD family hydrolase [Zavarzinella formosa]|uniref:HAD family hydrolase n=1 Tax=Zavarzinella formosa TaxID=360055 RepID=UPI0002D3810A|nr:HAD family phosphatase [Zavarzinella formosa]
MLKALFFDFGNVIGFFDHQRAIRQLVAYSDMPADELYTSLYAGELETRYECGHITTAELFEAIRPLGRLTCTQEQFVTAFCDIFWPNPPMADLIPRLRANGHRLFLASNTNDAHFNKFRVMFAETLSHFERLAVSHEGRARKPTREFFEYARSLAGVSPAECLLIDDLPVNVAGAKAAGWDAILYHHFDDLMTELAGRGVSV